MSVFFCLDDVFEILAARDKEDFSLDYFVPVHTRKIQCNGFRDDCLTLLSQPQMMDLNDPKAFYQMASLIEEIPLYHINLELVVDDILTQRHHNLMVGKAIQDAFGTQALPATTHGDAGKMGENIDGRLRHPMIGHLDKVTLCKIYLNFMRALPHGHDQFSFERFIIGRHAGPYHTQFDGYIFGEGGKVSAGILLGFGTRSDYDPRQPLQVYIESGQRQAKAMHITDRSELLLAWLEADHYQMRRSHDIHRILTLRGLPRMPNWVRTDVFHCMEKEAMKQIFATKLLGLDPDLNVAKKQPAIRKTLLLSAQGNIDDDLQKLLGQILNTGMAYSGVAEKFHEQAQLREKEARAL
ncbi:MAG: hypothetical protein JWO78_305 [Micavibrio sp.]|nr:hypothetical protein [Micavibrio sp.]